MESKVFGALSQTEEEDGLFLEGSVDIDGRTCNLSVQSPSLSCDEVLPWAERRHQALMAKMGSVREAIRDWIPGHYEEMELEMLSDPQKMVNALELSCINYCLYAPGEAEIWFYSTVDGEAAEVDEEDECPIATGDHDIVVRFDDNLEIIDIDIDG